MALTFLRRHLLILGFVLAPTTLVFAQNRLTNADEFYRLLQQSLAFSESYEGVDLSTLRIAIIDDSFDGFDRYREVLGARARIVDLNNQSTAGDGNKHGFTMAQVFMVASGAFRLPEAQQPELLLIPANGYSEFRKAVTYCLGTSKRAPVDIVLHSRHFKWGTDFRGGGFFNTEISRATHAGITWINAAGNLGNAVYYSPEIRTSRADEVELPGSSNTLLFENRYDDQAFEITLSWNDFQDSADYVTSTDLDFAVFPADASGNLTSQEPIAGGVGDKIQLRTRKKNPNKVYSDNAFESVNLLLPEAGYYAIKIYDRSKNFRDGDALRVVIDAVNPRALNFVHANHLNEVFAAADHPEAITVGVEAPFSSVMGERNVITKPNLILALSDPNFKFEFSDAASSGLDTSLATAAMAGILANLKAADAEFSSEKIINYMQQLPVHRSGKGAAWIAPRFSSRAPRPRAPQTATEEPRPKFRAIHRY